MSLQHNRTILAVDPGINGAMALFIDGRAELVVDMPTVIQRVNRNHRRHPDTWALSSIMAAAIAHAGERPLLVCERVSATPRDGSSRAFVFGRFFQSVRQCAACYGLDERTVPPATWKHRLRLSSDKKQSLAMARELFPGFTNRLARDKDDGRAEALLIGHWYLEHGQAYFEESTDDAV